MIDLATKKIVLIGGAGFIGHHLALKLSKIAKEVHIIDGLNVNNYLSFSGTTQNKDFSDLYIKILNERLGLLKKNNITLHVQDAGSYYPLFELIKTIEPNIIIHLAAVAHANKANQDPMSTFAHSTRTLENALETSRHLIEFGLEHFVYFSSSMIYGNFKDGFVDETTVPNPLGVYGALKYGGEKLVIAFNQVFKLPFTIVRPSALYGERCVSRRVIQLFIENAVLKKDININGDGSDKLDFTYIGDLVNGIVNVIENNNSKNEVFNLTFGESRSLKDVADIISLNFPGVKINYLPKDKLMPDRGTLSVEKAKRIINYLPENPIEIGVQKYINWYKQLLD